MEFLFVKWLHIVSATLLFGTGLGSAFYKWSADRTGNLAAIAHTNRLVVLADWLFTTPTVVLQPASGLWLAHRLGYPLDTPWIAAALALYVLAGACWLPVVALQIRMRDLAFAALAEHTSLRADYGRLARRWFWLGVPAFLTMLGVFALMVFKPAFAP